MAVCGNEVIIYIEQMKTADDTLGCQVVILTYKSFKKRLVLMLGTESLDVDTDWLCHTNGILNPLLMRFGIVANKDIIRKIAHAVEFCVFAYMLSLYWNKPIRAFYAGFTLAFLDESLQVITGRRALVTDIWIDLIGVGLGVLIERTVSLIRNKRHNNTTIISNK